MSRPCPLNCFEDAQITMFFDFTGIDYNTKVKCQAKGFLFSDEDTPFPDAMYGDVSGTWTYDTGVGWKAAGTVNSEGPAIVLPLIRPYNWELAVTFDYSPGEVAENVRLILGSMAPDNEYIALAFAQDNAVGASELVWLLYTNDGAGSVDVQFTGDALAGTGERVIKLRSLNGCVSVYDNEDNVWEDYTGRQAGTGFNPSHVFIQVQKLGAAALADITIKDITVIYS